VWYKRWREKIGMTKSRCFFHNRKLNIPFGWMSSSRARELLNNELGD